MCEAVKATAAPGNKKRCGSEFGLATTDWDGCRLAGLEIRAKPGLAEDGDYSQLARSTEEDLRFGARDKTNQQLGFGLVGICM